MLFEAKQVAWRYGLIIRARSLAMCMFTKYDVYNLSAWGWSVRTNIVIDDQLMNSALKATGVATKREAVELGLKTLIKLKKQEGIKRLRGRLKWDGDLDELRGAK